MWVEYVAVRITIDSPTAEYSMVGDEGKRPPQVTTLRLLAQVKPFEENTGRSFAEPGVSW